ncbi:MAG: GntR family transcriptional regulator [Desulfobacterales bacterium]|nr:GntR family transcriptional regulator [Desulfobacterales bacterium]
MKKRPAAKNNAVSAREKTYEFLKEKVLSGQFRPGARLTEEHLAAELGVSRTPIREALHKLELEGLVRALETRGFCVSQDSIEEIKEVFEIRTILEGYALRYVCKNVQKEIIDKLDAIIEKSEKAYQNQKIDAVFKYNTQFHDTLHGLIAHKPRLLGLIVDLRQYVLRYRKDTLQHMDGARRSIDGHHKIMMALQLEDQDLCERIMREHIQEAREDALYSLFGKN